jgi:hypothetical protein
LYREGDTMPIPITWTKQADASLLSLRADGQPWHFVAGQLHVGRNAAIERARRLGLAPMTRIQPAPRPPVARIDRPALPAGHPLTWHAITDNTPLHGGIYPFPVFL